MLSSVLNKQAQSVSPGGRLRLRSHWSIAHQPSAMPPSGNVLPINSDDETGNNRTFAIPGFGGEQLSSSGLRS